MRAIARLLATVRCGFVNAQDMIIIVVGRPQQLLWIAGSGSIDQHGRMDNRKGATALAIVNGQANGRDGGGVMVVGALLGWLRR